MSHIIQLLCYEPAGKVMELTPDDLTRHVLGFGATGSGKTTSLINPIIRQILAWRKHEPHSKSGLLVLDPKGDDSPEKVRAYAREAGRESDLVVLSTGGSGWYDLLGGLARLDQTQTYSRRLLSGTRDMGKENAYWTETRDGLVETALVLLLANGTPVRFSEAISFMQGWWFSPDLSLIRPRLDFVREVIAAGILDHFSQRRLELALADVNSWASLDSRTKEIHRSTLHNALRPLMSAAAHALFSPNQIEFRPRAILEGKILVVSIDAISHPDLARLIFRLVRQDFYAAVQSRAPVRPDRDRLCGLVADELALSAMPDDVQALSVIREKGGFVIAAAQSINGLDEVLGWRAREALLANFNTCFFFAARESALDAHALLTLGMRERHNSQNNISEYGDVADQKAVELPREPVCAPGALARLKPHQAYAKLADGTCTEWPVWLQPCYFSGPLRTAPVPADSLGEAVASVREGISPSDRGTSGVASFLLHMHRQKHPLKTTPGVVAAAWPLCIPKISRNQLIRDLERFPGAHALPSCWIAALEAWLVRNMPLATTITGFEATSGVLWPKMARASVNANQVAESINLFIYPSLWRPLASRHSLRLFVERPDLRAEISSLPDFAPPDANSSNQAF